MTDDNIQVDICAAAKKGAAELIAELLQDGADPNHTWPDGNTPLHFSVYGNNEYTAHSCLEELLKHGADPNRLNARGESPLYIATEREAISCVGTLLEAGADPNPEKGKAPLLACADHWHGQIAAMLLRAGANPLVTNEEGKAMPDLAREKGGERVAALLELYTRTKGFTEFRQDEISAAAGCAPPDVLEKLLQDGADPNAEDEYGYTPLHYATCAYYDQLERMRLLVRYGADYCARGKQGVPFIFDWIRLKNNEQQCPKIAGLLQGVDVNRLDKCGCNLLHYAACDGLYHVAKTLLSIGADPSVRTAKGGLPIEIALGKMEDDNDEHDKIVELLRPVSPEPRSPLPRRLGHELVCAAQCGDKAAVRDLLAAGAPPNGDDWGVLSLYGYDTIPLFELAENSYEGETGQKELAEITRMLIKAGADVNLSRADLSSPLHAAARSNATGIIRELLKAGANVTACEDANGTPLEIAEEVGSARAAKMLRKWMLDHNIPAAPLSKKAKWQPATWKVQGENLPPIFAAIAAGDESLVERLLLQGKHVDLQLSDQTSLLHYAAERGQTGCVRVLIKYGADVDVLDSQFLTPLYLAASKDHTETVRVLLQAGAWPELFAPGMEQTPLMACAHHKSVTTAWEILRRGANPFTTNSSCIDAMDVAKESGNEALLQLLELYAWR